MKTKIEIKANKLIDERNKLTTEISKLWNIIATENVLRKGNKRNYDLKQVLYRIKDLYETTILTKLKIQCINMGIKLKDLPKDANIINIYKLSAYNEYCVKVDEMMRLHTINPTIKVKRGKRALSVTEELTHAYFEREKREYTLKTNELRKRIEEFNNNTEIEEEDVPLYLVA